MSHIFATDADNDPVTLTCTSIPSFDTYTAGIYTITCTANDGKGGTDSKSYTLTVVDNGDPSISGTTIQWHHNDPQGSLALLTDQNGNIIRTTDYYPYGAPRVNIRSGASGQATVSSRTYVGQYYDADEHLNYLNARYYDAEAGRFISEDPVFLEVGGEDFNDSLLNPQTQNSYGYAGGNPIINKDPSGRYLETVFDVAMLANSIHEFNEDPGIINGIAVALDSASVALPVVPAVGGIASRGAARATYSVYHGLDEAGNILYVGITKRAVAERAAEHLTAKGTGKEFLTYEKVAGTGNLTKNQARAIEQATITKYGMMKNDGTLLNKVNSIAPSKQAAIFNNATDMRIFNSLPPGLQQLLGILTGGK